MWARKVSIRKKRFLTARQICARIVPIRKNKFAQLFLRKFRISSNKTFRYAQKCTQQQKWQTEDEMMLANLNDIAKMTILPYNNQHEGQGKEEWIWRNREIWRREMIGNEQHHDKFVIHRLTWNNLTKYRTASFLAIHVSMALPRIIRVSKNNCSAYQCQFARN